MSELLCTIYFDGEAVAYEVGLGWKDNTQRSTDIGGGNWCYINDAELITDESGEYVFTYVDNTDTRHNRPHMAGVRTNRLLDGLGNHSTGPWGVVVLER